MPIEKISQTNTTTFKKNETKPLNAKTPDKTDVKKDGNKLLLASLSALAVATIAGITIFKSKFQQTPKVSKEEIDAIVEEILKESKPVILKKGKAYEGDALFTGIFRRASSTGNIMITHYKEGIVVERTYKNINKQNSIAEINKLYNHDVEGIKMVDTKTTYKSGEVVTTFEVVEKNKKFADSIEQKISKADFDNNIDEKALAIYPQKEGAVSTTWDLGDGLVLKETAIKNGTVRKLIQDGKIIRRRIDTPLGKIIQFKNTDGNSIQIHENLGFIQVKTSTPNGTTKEYIGRNLEEMRGINKL